MSAQAPIYVSAFLAMTVLMGLFAGLIYRRHRMMVNQHRAYERMAQERIRQAQDENLPPFYIDHVRDRACVFEGELPPDNTFLRMLEVVVVRPRRQESMQDLVDAGIVPPGIGNTEAGSGIETEGQSEATSNSPHSHHRRNLSSTLGLPDLVVSEMPHLGLGIPVVESGVIRPTPATLRRPTRAMTPNNTPSAMAAAVLVAPVPTTAVTIHGDSNSNDMGDGQESIHTLPPPSYDITRTHAITGIAEPNSIAHPVNAPSATGDFVTHHLRHHHSHTHTQQDNNQQQTSTPSSSAIEQQLNSPSSTSIDAPRYSDEFPSHISHEQHLEGYRSARAISNVSLRQQDGSPSLSAAAATFVDQTTNAAAAIAPTESSHLSSSPSSLSSLAQSPFPAESSH
ncbi:hypothetical protein EC957_009238 [Mortierella hygrophila]|uniref:Uncharacterized protein n=1 Tax=Mortierella hygrophila TaxID=979708 RepID=A0A9P6FHF9_9FUNG|nr:hypothetical protein EC957_009238 [Mortierella hygrophila]